MGRVDRDIDAWMARLADGDRAAFDPLYDRLWPVVVAFCARRLGDTVRAEDAAQQALIRVFEKASGYDRTRPALPWVLAFAAWECRTVAGRADRRREAPMDDVTDDRDSPEEEVLRNDVCAAVRQAIGELQPADEEALWAWMRSEVREHPVASTLRKRMERGRRRLGALWRKRHGPT